MEFRILGPLEVRREDHPLALGGAKQRALLAILLIQANKVVAVERLAELLWGDDPPVTAAHAIEVYVSQLRKALEPDGAPYRVLLTSPAGYSVRIEPAELDAKQFQTLVAGAEQLSPEKALAQLNRALALWRGAALADFATEQFALSEAARLNELHLHATEKRIDAELALGRHAALVGELVSLTSEHPLRERLCAHLMVALYRSGRQAEASDVYQRTRDRLVDELGMEPGPELQGLLKRILQQDPGLDTRRVDTNLPSGTVTFLMSDVEQATRMWDSAPQVAGQAIDRHNALVVENVAGHRGQVVESGREGDGFLAVFRNGSDAVACALDLQRSMLVERWPSPSPVRVRIGLHTGEAELREGHYMGAALYRCGRLMAIAHGGQVLLSQAVEELVADRLPDGCDLRDLGPHRLRDISQPVRVFQLRHADLPSDFAPLAGRREGTLPLQPTPLVGREQEARDVVRLLLEPNTRLVSLIGPGGVGKTRLGLRIAEYLLDSFVDGVVWVSLASVFDPRVVPSAVAQVTGAQIEPDRPAEETLVDALRGKELLLVLDNFEQVIEATPLISTLLGSCPKLKILLTTRRALRLTAEREYPVSPLAIPNATAEPNELERFDSVRLFADRARAVKPAFSLDDRNSQAVVEICQRLDGLPLAIELAAARIRVLQPSAILARLEHSLSLLGGTAADAPKRQQTLRATIDWSYQLLDEREQKFLRRLGVFRGGWTLEAAESIVGDLGLDLVDAHDSLAAKSLVRALEGTSEPRFVLLETIRDFCVEQLDLTGEADEIRNRHAQFFTSLMFRAYGEIHGPKQAAWIEQLESELDNVRAARAWMYELAKKGDVIALTGGLLITELGWWHSHIRGYHAELLTAIEGFFALTEIESVPELARGPALTIAGFACLFIGKLEAAMQYSEASLDLVRDDLLTLSIALGTIAQCRLFLGDVKAAREGWAKIRTIVAPLEKDRFDDITTDWILSWGVMFSATTEIAAGNRTAVRPAIEEALSHFESMGDIHGRAWATYAIATLALLEGDTEHASRGYYEGLALFRELGDRPNEAMVLEGFGDIAVTVGAFAEAQAWLNRAVDVYREMGSRRGQGMALEGYAALAHAEGNHQRALLLAGAANAARGASGMAIELFPRQRPLFDEVLVMAKADPAYNLLLSQGRGMPLDEAIALARARTATQSQPVR